MAYQGTLPYQSFHYTGPIQLGSVVAHQCGAAQLFSVKSGFDIEIVGLECTYYTLEVYVMGEQKAVFKGEVSIEGRKQIGKELLYFLRELQGLPKYGEWGSLVGVRPTKLVHKLLDRRDDVQNVLRHQYNVSEEKIDLLLSVAKVGRSYVEKSYVENHKNHISVYGHIPFCDTHCTYCSFPYGLARHYKPMDAFVQAYLQDGQHLLDLVQRYGIQIDDIYIGGGTPTSLREEAFDTVLELCAQFHEEGREFTLEAGRPDSVSSAKVESMVRHGVNRISINPQSMQDDVLKAIRRGHSVQDVVDLYKYIRKHTQFSVNMDFICGLPLQSTISAQENLIYIERFMPHNITVHTLALKKGSPLYDEGATHMPEEETVKEMVYIMHQGLLALGYIPYYMYRQQYMKGQLENIGYTLPGFESTYNIHMIEERQTTLSIGPGSVSKWIEPVEFRQIKQYMPKDVDIYKDTLEELLYKRETISEEFWRG